MEGSSYPDPKVVEMSRAFVNVVAHRETSHGEKEVLVGKEKTKVCKAYLTIPCSVHVEGDKAVGRFFQGGFGVPATIFCDPSGKELSRESGGLGSSELVKKMQEALAKVTGDKIPLPAWRQGRQSMADGEAALDKGDYKKAIEVFTKVGKIKGKTFKAMSEEALKKVEEAGESLLKGALEAGNDEDKKKALRKIADDFKPLGLSGRAKKELEAIK